MSRRGRPSQTFFAASPPASLCRSACVPRPQTEEAPAWTAHRGTDLVRVVAGTGRGGGLAKATRPSKPGGPRATAVAGAAAASLGRAWQHAVLFAHRQGLPVEAIGPRKAAWHPRVTFNPRRRRRASLFCLRSGGFPASPCELWPFNSKTVFRSISLLEESVCM